MTSSAIASGSSSSTITGERNEMGGSIVVVGTVGAVTGGDAAQALHGATRIVCLNLTRCALRAGFGPIRVTASTVLPTFCDEEKNDTEEG